jgi:predicted permease
VWLVVRACYEAPGEAQFASVVEAATPSMMTALLLADRFRLDSAAAALLIGWSTILFWLTLPLLMAFGLLR